NVENQFENFEEKQVGYYGEMGYQVIAAATSDLFPHQPQRFIYDIMVPEIAVRLIKEDQQLVGTNALEEAFNILCASSTYGTFKFPD
ncbi:hypothetical protein C8J56DRAFT_748402, partial [Mycena floridula]